MSDPIPTRDLGGWARDRRHALQETGMSVPPWIAVLAALALFAGCATHRTYGPDGQPLTETKVRGDGYAMGCVVEPAGVMPTQREVGGAPSITELETGVTILEPAGAEPVCPGSYWEVRGGTASDNLRGILRAFFELPGHTLGAVMNGLSPGP